MASLVLHLEFHGDNASNPRRRCVADENTYLIEASGPEQAYEKALALAESAAGEPFLASDGRHARWVFVGFSDFVPIYEPLGDGAEILWNDLSGCAVSTVEGLVHEKEDLPIFRAD